MKRNVKEKKPNSLPARIPVASEQSSNNKLKLIYDLNDSDLNEPVSTKIKTNSTF